MGRRGALSCPVRSARLGAAGALGLPPCVLLPLGIGAEPSLVRKQAELALTALTRRAKR